MFYLEPIPRISPYLQEDWMFAVLLVLMIALAVVKYSYPRILMRMTQALLRVRMLLQLMREGMLMSHRTAVTFFLTFAISSALLLYMAARSFQWPIIEWFGISLFPILTGIIVAVYLWKIISIRIVQALFGGNGGLSEYLNYSFVINALLGILWLPLILIAAVSLSTVAKSVLIVAAIIFALAWLVRIVQGILFAMRQGVFPVYIILYLCALEILPLAVIAKGIAEVEF